MTGMHFLLLIRLPAGAQQICHGLLSACWTHNMTRRHLGLHNLSTTALLEIKGYSVCMNYTQDVLTFPITTTRVYVSSRAIYTYSFFSAFATWSLPLTALRFLGFWKCALGRHHHETCRLQSTMHYM